jgi:hypothetical protein
MNIRTRKLIGTFGLLALVPIWALLAMALAQSALASAGHLVTTLYYVVAGLGWIVLAMPLVRWMSRPDIAPPR